MAGVEFDFEIPPLDLKVAGACIGIRSTSTAEE